MSFRNYKDVIGENDTVVLVFGFDCMLQITTEKGKVSQTRYGALRHADLLGKPFGSKVQCSKGWVYALHPTPELWTVTLPHRTQILYSTDISVVTFQLDLKPGSIVIESGTGSGSLSHALIRTIAPNGHLHTFDFHEQRVAKAKEEFAHHNIGDIVTCTHKDVLKEGFGLKDVADAVFLDLPAPWEAIPHVKEAMKKEGGRVCSFSPCIEQVQRTCEKMEQLGFRDIQSLECLSRAFDVRSVNMPLPDLGYGVGKYPDYKDIGGSVNKPVIGQIINNDEQDLILNEDGNSIERKNDAQDQSRELSDDEIPVKKIKVDNSNGKRGKWKESWIKKERPLGPAYTFKSGLAPLQMPGHTGYLTFATLYQN